MPVVRAVDGGEATGVTRGATTRPLLPAPWRASILAMPSFDPAATYVCLSPSGDASTLEVGADFWATIGDRRELDEGRLVAAFPCDADWKHWEMHPHGEEILVMLGGRLTLVLDDDGEETRVRLEAGRACVVPRGVWHRALVHEPGLLLGITYGRGTEHRTL